MPRRLVLGQVRHEHHAERGGAGGHQGYGWSRFYRNDKRFGPGFTEGVTGPLVRAAGLYGGDKVTALPGGVAADGAGGRAWPEA